MNIVVIEPRHRERDNLLDQVVLVCDDAAGLENGLFGLGDDPVGRVALVRDDHLLLQVDSRSAYGERQDAGEKRRGLHFGGCGGGCGGGCFEEKSAAG